MLCRTTVRGPTVCRASLGRTALSGSTLRRVHLAALALALALEGRGRSSLPWSLLSRSSLRGAGAGME